MVQRSGSALKTSALAGAGVLAMLGFAAQPALASSKATVQNGTLQTNGTGASDKPSVTLDPTHPNLVQIDLGEDGTPDFTFDRSTFTMINISAGGGHDEVRVGNGFSDKAVTIWVRVSNETLGAAAQVATAPSRSGPQ